MAQVRPRLVAVAAAAALGLLLATAPTPRAALREVGGTASSADPTAPLVALLSLAAWALSCWLVAVVAVTLAARVPGGPGRAAAAVARRVAPAAVRRGVEMALGLTVTATVLGAGVATAAPDVPGPLPSAVPSLDWPGTAAPSLDWPSSAAPAAAEPAPPVAPVRGSTVPAAPDPVVVQPGDSLWDIAERDLAAREGVAPTEARTAAAWPAWWAANRDAVGADPDLVHPGTSLTPPQHLPPAAPSSDDA